LVWYCFDLKGFLRMAPECRNMWEINIYYKLGFIKCTFRFFINYENVHSTTSMTFCVY
jgi:hypothetical protein